MDETQSSGRTLSSRLVSAEERACRSAVFVRENPRPEIAKLSGLFQRTLDPNLDPMLARCGRSLSRQRARNYGPFALSGRLDSNQRPPGPQPERWGAAQLMRPVFAGFLASEVVPVAFNFFPKLFRERVFGTTRTTPSRALRPSAVVVAQAIVAHISRLRESS
jgi:hypothetical protein